MENLKLQEGESPYTYMIKELDMLNVEISGLDDDALVDECFNLAYKFGEMKVLGISEDFLLSGKLSKKNRKYLDNFYILVHTGIVWSVDGEVLHFR